MKDKGLGEPFTRERRTEEHSFDDLARVLATGTLSRGEALKLVGAAVMSAALMPLFPDTAQALTRRQRRRCRRRGGAVCSSGTRASEGCCPSGLCDTNGGCACPQGETLCSNNQCGDPNSCSSNEIFNSSTCRCEACYPGTVKCDNQCKDPNTTCGPNERINPSTCQCEACPQGTVQCGNECVDPATFCPPGEVFDPASCSCLID